MKAALVKLKKDANRLVEALEDAQIYGVAELLNIAVETIDEAIDEYDEYEADHG